MNRLLLIGLSDHQISRLVFKGNSKIDEIIRNPRGASWYTFLRKLNNNMVHLNMGGNILGELEVETMMKESSGEPSG